MGQEEDKEDEEEDEEDEEEEKDEERKRKRKRGVEKMAEGKTRFYSLAEVKRRR